VIVIRHSYVSIHSKRRAAGSFKAAKTMAIGSALSHVKYIQHRPGRDRDKGGREVFSHDDDHANMKFIKDAIRGYKSNGVVIHKLTLAPEINPADPKAFTREVMHQLEAEKGMDLKWCAVVHKNTEHHHIHVVVLPKDEGGSSVRFTKHDYDLMKEFGDRYLDRTHTFEFREARRVRAEKQRLERQEKYEREKQERIFKGEELPWLHKKIVREQLEPYETWAKKQKLEKSQEKEAQSFEYKEKRYSENDNKEQLTSLQKQLRENSDKAQRLPKENYQQLRQWLEVNDRKQFSGELTRQLSSAKNFTVRQDKSVTSPAGNRVVSPMQQELMRNPIIGLFLTEASIAAEIVRSIPLTEQRDRFKESQEDLEKIKRDREAKQNKRKRPEEKAKDEETIQKVEQTIDDNKKFQENTRQERQKQKDKRDKNIDYMG
jgi:hypothetical protein